MNGILLMCFNSPTYGRYAYNMAHSIRYYSDIPIHLISDHESIQGINTDIFTSHDFVEFERNEYGKIDNCLAKIKLFERSPFEKTLYLDVDGVMMKNPEELFEILKGEYIYVQPMGSGKKFEKITYTWAANDIVYSKFKIKDDAIFHSCQTSIIYFDKSKEAKDFYKKLESNYTKKLKPIEYREMWGRSSQHPDELYYSITMAQLEIVPKNFTPIFFPERLENISVIESNYYVLSMYGGNNVKPYALKHYDRIMQNVLGKKGLNHYCKAHKLYQKKFINTK
jgi:alpha-N-acetylglucosamine transferase